MELLYKFYFACFLRGEIEGVFIAEEAEVVASLGHTISFFEPWGKNTSEDCTLAAHHFRILTADQDFIAKWRKYGIGEPGHNPIFLLSQQKGGCAGSGAPVVYDVSGNGCCSCCNAKWPPKADRVFKLFERERAPVHDLDVPATALPAPPPESERGS